MEARSCACLTPRSLPEAPVKATVDMGTQTDTEVLLHIADMRIALDEAHAIIGELNNRIYGLEKESSDYRHKWMTECRYSSTLIKEGAEPSGVSQVKDWEGSSPYNRYHDCRMCSFSFRLFNSNVLSDSPIPTSE
jgi:hypothetical protein